MVSYWNVGEGCSLRHGKLSFLTFAELFAVVLCVMCHVDPVRLSTQSFQGLLFSLTPHLWSVMIALEGLRVQRSRQCRNCHRTSRMELVEDNIDQFQLGPHLSIVSKRLLVPFAAFEVLAENVSELPQVLECPYRLVELFKSPRLSDLARPGWTWFLPAAPTECIRIIINFWPPFGKQFENCTLWLASAHHHSMPSIFVWKATAVVIVTEDPEGMPEKVVLQLFVSAHHCQTLPLNNRSTAVPGH